MAMQQNGAVVGVFKDDEDARDAIRALRDAGFTDEQIGVARSEQQAAHDADWADDDSGDGTGNESYAAEGAITGVAAGAGIGALWGMGILAGVLPIIGPAIAGGTLAVILSSAAAGAATAGLAGSLIGMGLSKEESEFYESEMKAGRTIVTVTASGRYAEAMSLLREYGAYDMSTRPSADQTSETMAGKLAQGSSTNFGQTTAATSKPQTGGAGKTIQAREEQLQVHKTPVQSGEVLVHKEAHTEHKTIDVPVTREEVVIERHPGHGAPVSESNFGAGQELRIPVSEEQVDVTKETVVAEEVNVGKRKVQGTEKVDENLRKEKIKVEKRGDVDVRDDRNNP